MRKNYTYNVKTVYSRNELADALSIDTPVIRIEGELYSAMEAEINKRIKDVKDTKKLNGAIIASSALALLMATSFPILAIANIALSAAVGYKYSKADFSRYAFFVYQDNDKQTVLMINKKAYDAELDVIEGYENFLFTTKTTCPICKRKIKKDEYKESLSNIFCETCQKKIVIGR